MRWGIRKIIAIVCIAILSVVVLICLFTGKEIPQSINNIISAFIGYIGYYFGKSTALDTPSK